MLLLISVMYDKIMSLDESRSNWIIKVRYTRMWPSISLCKEKLYGFNFILIDNKVCFKYNVFPICCLTNFFGS